VVCVKWAVQRGQIPIPFAIHREKYLANLRAVVTDPLTDEEMAAIAHIDRNCRLIKGHVFLWKEGQYWEDLWARSENSRMKKKGGGWCAPVSATMQVSSKPARASGAPPWSLSRVRRSWMGGQSKNAVRC
jgi:hypothetical protein